MDLISLEPGSIVSYKGNEAVILYHAYDDVFSLQECHSKIIHTVEAKDLELATKKNVKKFTDALTEKEWQVAVYRYNIIRPLIEKKCNDITRVATEAGKSRPTIYRWLSTYNKNLTVASLAPEKKVPVKRINPQTENAISYCIGKHYLNRDRKSIRRLMWHIEEHCREKGIDMPHESTVIRRVNALSEERVMSARYGKKKADEKFNYKGGSFPGADFPLAVIQIDHTPLDIILVDEINREPFKSPNLTIAFDVYSRMVVGFYLSFDPVGSIAVGMCIVNSILPKESYIEGLGLTSKWPCWGIPRTIHLDNAKEFRGNMLKKACLNYGINLDYRPPGEPHYGGHVERYIGNLNNHIHDIRGTKFSNVAQKSNYDSMGKASMTISELEVWLVDFFTGVYHKSKHSSLNCSPEERFFEGIKETGYQPRLTSESIIYDFMPFVERTIQDYGVSIDGIRYYKDLMRIYINSLESTKKKALKRKFLFRVDPRDISKVYFFNPATESYVAIPCSDLRMPSLSRWEHLHIKRSMSNLNVPINEDSIFEAKKRMMEIEDKAINSTKRARLPKLSRAADSKRIHIGIPKEEKNIEKESENFFGVEDWEDIKPYREK